MYRFSRTLLNGRGENYGTPINYTNKHKYGAIVWYALVTGSTGGVWDVWASGSLLGVPVLTAPPTVTISPASCITQASNKWPTYGLLIVKAAQK